MSSAADHFFGCDDHGNIFSLRRNTVATSGEERSKLEGMYVCMYVCIVVLTVYTSVYLGLGQSEFHLGDYVNVLVRGSLLNQPLESEGDTYIHTYIYIHTYS